MNTGFEDFWKHNRKETPEEIIAKQEMEIRKLNDKIFNLRNELHYRDDKIFNLKGELHWRVNPISIGSILARFFGKKRRIKPASSFRSKINL